IIINKTIKLTGQMMADFTGGSTVFLFDLSNYDEDTIALNVNNRNVIIENLLIENENNDKEHHGLGTDSQTSIYYCYFKRIRVRGFKHNFHFFNAWGNIFDQCYASEGYNGFYLRGFGTSVQVNQC